MSNELALVNACAVPELESRVAQGLISPPEQYLLCLLQLTEIEIESLFPSPSANRREWKLTSTQSLEPGFHSTADVGGELPASGAKTPTTNTSRRRFGAKRQK
jgi:hypothetical protein